MSEHFKDGDRVSHARRGLGTVKADPAGEDLVAAHKTTPDTVYVAWDDDRFPVAPTARSELEKVPEAAAAISTGF